MYTAGGTRDKGWGVTKIFDRQRGGIANFFLHLLKEEVLFCGFFVKEEHPNYSMLEENLLAYFLYPRNTLFTGLSLLIKKPSVFIVKLILLLSQQELQNFNKSSIFL